MYCCWSCAPSFTTAPPISFDTINFVVGLMFTNMRWYCAQGSHPITYITGMLGTTSVGQCHSFHCFRIRTMGKWMHWTADTIVSISHVHVHTGETNRIHSQTMSVQTCYQWKQFKHTKWSGCRVSWGLSYHSHQVNLWQQYQKKEKEKEKKKEKCKGSLTMYFYGTFWCYFAGIVSRNWPDGNGTKDLIKPNTHFISCVSILVCLTGLLDDHQLDAWHVTAIGTRTLGGGGARLSHAGTIFTSPAPRVHNSTQQSKSPWLRLTCAFRSRFAGVLTNISVSSCRTGMLRRSMLTK